MRTGIWIATLVIAAAGCGGKKDDGKPKAKPKVALELTGAVTVSLAGEDGECNAGGGGLKEARSFEIHAGQLGAPADFSLQLNALTDGPTDGAEGATFVRLGKAQFLRETGASTLVTEGNLFTTTSTLKEQDGDRTIVVKGTVQCP